MFIASEKIKPLKPISSFKSFVTTSYEREVGTLSLPVSSGTFRWAIMIEERPFLINFLYG